MSIKCQFFVPMLRLWFSMRLLDSVPLKDENELKFEAFLAKFEILRP